MTVTEGQRYAYQGRTIRVLHVIHSPKNGAWAYIAVSRSVFGERPAEYWKLPLPAEARLLGGAQ